MYSTSIQMAEYLWQNLEVPQVKEEHTKNAPEILLWKENFSIFFCLLFCQDFSFSRHHAHMCYTYVRLLILSLDIIRPNPKQIFAIIYTFFFPFRICVCVCVCSPGKCPFHKCAHSRKCVFNFLLFYVTCVCACVCLLFNDHIYYLYVWICTGPM